MALFYKSFHFHISMFQTTGNAEMMTCICHISLSN